MRTFRTIVVLDVFSRERHYYYDLDTYYQITYERSLLIDEISDLNIDMVYLRNLIKSLYINITGIGSSEPHKDGDSCTCGNVTIEDDTGSNGSWVYPNTFSCLITLLMTLGHLITF